MKRHIGWLICIAFLFSGLRAAAQEQQPPQRGPSTPEERARAVKVAHQLEQDPLGPDAKADRDWVVQWIIDIPDLTVSVCDQYFGSSLPDPPTTTTRDVFEQMMISSAAFMIEHSDKANDEQAVALAGLLGSLKAYEAILKQDSGARWPDVDRLVKMRDHGTLDDFVATTLMKCNSKPDEEPPPGTLRTSAEFSFK